MKKVSLLILMFIVLMSTVAAVEFKPVDLETVNKSGYEVILQLQGKGSTVPIVLAGNHKLKKIYGLYPPELYYLRLPLGDRDTPTVKFWTISPDLYSARVMYMKDGVMVYDYTQEISLLNKTKLTFTPPKELAKNVCEKNYDGDNYLLKRCLEGLKGFRFDGDRMYKFLPTLWLPNWEYMY